MKKIQAFLLVTAMVISSFSPAIRVKAAPSYWLEGGGGTYRNFKSGETTYGNIKLTKKIVGFDEQKGEYTVDLRVDGDSETSTSTTAEPMDIVLAIDQSHSMKDYGRMANAKRAAKSFIAEVDKKNQEAKDKGLDAPIKVGVVSYYKYAELHSGLTDNKTDLEKAVDSISYGWGTNIQAGLQKADKILSAGQANKKVIVLIGDGDPNWRFIEGTERAWATYPAWYAKEEAKKIKNKGIEIHSVGINPGGSGRDCLKNIATGSNYHETDNGATDLGKILQDILKQVTETVFNIKDGKIADKLSAYVDLTENARISGFSANKALATAKEEDKAGIADNIQELALISDNGEITLAGKDGKKLVLGKGDYVTLSYKVQLKDNWKNGEWHEAGAADAVFYPDKEVSKNLAFANPEVKQLKTKDLPITKVWVDAGYQADRPTQIEFSLKSGNDVLYKVVADSKGASKVTKPNGDAVKDINVTVAVNGSNPNQWDITVKKLPLYSKGQLIQYTVEENKLNGYTENITKNAGNDGFTITNTLDTTDVTVTKIWEDADNSENKRPSEITFTLKGNDGKEYKVTASTNLAINNNKIILDGQTVAGAKVTTTKDDNKWIIKIAGLKKVAKDGQAITYTIEKEEQIKDYVPATIKNNTITNKLDYSKITQDIKVTKVWEVGEATEYKTDVTVILSGNGKTEEKKIALGTSEVVFSNIPKYGTDGKKIAYGVTEKRDFANNELFKVVPVTGDAESGFTVKNILDFAELNKTDNLTITINKKWDNNISGLNIPDKIKVKVTSSVAGAAVIEKELEAAENWTVTIDKLDKYDSNGKLITYTITEETISGFKLKDDIEPVKGSNNVIGRSETFTRTLINVAENGENDGKIKINIKKVDSADETKGLGGAIFKITSLDANMTPNALFAKTVTSQANGMIENIKLPVEGIYRIEETKAPDGYLPGQDVIIKVKEDDVSGTGRLLFHLYTDKDEQGNYLQTPEWTDVLTGETGIPTFTIKNTKIKNGDIFKIDEGGTPLSGAQFDLYKRNTGLVPDAYAIFAEVDNSEIQSENIDVTVQLYKKSGEADAVAIGESQKLTTSVLNNILADDLTPNVGDKYYVTFSFSSRFNAESITFDSNRNTFVLKLVLNPNPIAQSQQSDSNNSAPAGQGNASNAPINPAGNTGSDNTANNNETNGNGTTTVQSIPAFAALPTGEESNTETGSNTEESNPANSVENTESSATQDTQNGSTEAGKPEGETGSNAAEAEKSESNSENQAGKVEQKGNEVKDSQAQVPLVYATITKTSESVELTGDYAKYQTGSIISADGGLINLPSLPDGNYYLVETQAPNRAGGHYEREARKIRFDIVDHKIVISDEDLESGFMWLVKKEEKAADGTTITSYQILNKWIPDPPADNPGEFNPYIPPQDPQDNPNQSNPSTTIDDNQTPLSNADGNNTKQAIEDEDVILDDLDDDEVPLSNGDEKIKSDKVPLADMPKTADTMRHIGIYVVAYAAAMFILLLKGFKKKKD